MLLTRQRTRQVFSSRLERLASEFEANLRRARSAIVSSIKTPWVVRLRENMLLLEEVER